ncbi:expressed protein [Phakopsora pachyrhizi]|uniref:Expressed protein n=1 Tax=Phakopsora pachyrhizi TaxID=170000 RepID=A0AAV0AZ17_PHAPC|nr:expressed protein [Phakopsora pachyrhizi]
MKNLVETEPTDVSEGTSFNTLASNFGITPQEEARELYKEGQRSNEIVEGSSSLHFNHDPNISQKIRPLKAQDDVIKVLELPLIQKQKNQKLSPEDKFIIEKETLLKKKQSSSKAVLMPIHMIKNSIEKHAKFKKNKRKTSTVSENKLKDAIDEFRLKLEYLGKSSSSEGSLNLFLETMDKFADNISTDNYQKSRKGINTEDSKMYSQKHIIKSFLAHNAIPISQSLADDLKKAFVALNDKGDKYSDQLFFEMINYQTKENLDQNFYLLPYQLSKFFNYRNSNFKAKNLVLDKVPKNWNYYSDHLAKKICTALNLVPWEDFFTCDSKVEIFEKRQFYLKDRRTGKFGVTYGKLPNLRFDLRKLFIIFSTLINKVYCSGENDLKENFHIRQKSAIDFFDRFISLLEIDCDDDSKYFIKNENLPLNEDARTMFSKHSLKSPNDKFQFRALNGDKNKIDVVWKVMPLWLARDKYEYYEEIYCSIDKISLNFKLFFNSFLFYILMA